MSEEEKFTAYVRELIRETDPAPETPREDMWTRIAEARRFRRGVERAPRLARPLVWPAALAAMLLIGIAIGRVSLPSASVIASATPEVAPGTSEASSFDVPFRLAAVQHLDAAAALLAALPEDARRGHGKEVASWAQDLLVTTRLLRDSPAADDPRMATLFRDLELILAQIASLSGSNSGEELELIEEGMRENDVLIRVRAATERRPAAGI